MKNRILFAVAGVLSLSVVVFAGEIWKDKPYETWDQKDLQKILNDSPWVQKVDVIGSSDAPMSGADGGSGTGGSGGGRGGMSRPSDNDPSAGGAGNAMMGGKLEYDARWVSSRTLREAYARAAELNGKTSDEVTKSVTTTPAMYQVVLISRDLRAFQAATPDALKQSIYLETKKSHQKILADKVTIVPDPDGKRASFIVIQFPKTTDKGEATLATDEKGTDLVASAGSVKLKFHFDFAKMTDKQGLDL